MSMGLPLEKEECWLLQVDHHHHHHHHHNYVHLLREWDLNCERLDLGYFDQKQVPRPLCIHHIVTKTDIIIIITISHLRNFNQPKLNNQICCQSLRQSPPPHHHQPPPP